MSQCRGCYFHQYLPKTLVIEQEDVEYCHRYQRVLVYPATVLNEKNECDLSREDYFTLLDLERRNILPRPTITTNL